MTRISALARHPLAIVGAVVTTASAVVFITLVIAMLAGMLHQPVRGSGGLHRHSRRVRDGTLCSSRRACGSSDENSFAIRPRRPNGLVVDFPPRRGPAHRPPHHGTHRGQHRHRCCWPAMAACTRWKSPSFCGQACHTPMRPQFQAWHGAAHSGRRLCRSVTSERARRHSVHAKLSGVRQLVMVATNTYPRPIPPGAQMPPGAQAETCKSCHEPGRAIGDRIRVIREYADDEANTETMTVLQMHMSVTKSSARAIHWHADPVRSRRVRGDGCGAADDPACVQ